MDFKDGDIFIFEAEDDFLSKCIAYITRSDVSHAALLKDNKMVEMGAYGISQNSYCECPEGIRVDIMRLKPEQDTAPIAEAVKYYLDSGVKYDYPQLILLGGLLLYWPFRPTQKYSKAIEAILKAACLLLDKLLNEMIHKDTEVMMCSQLVYQCYLDCGDDYMIEIENGILQSQKKEHEIRLIDSIKGEQEDFILPTIEEASDIEELAEELYGVFMEQDHEMEIIKDVELQKISGYADSFYKKIKKLESISQTSRPMVSLFVTPADLRYHAVNLEKIGELHLVRERE